MSPVESCRRSSPECQRRQCFFHLRRNDFLYRGRLSINANFEALHRALQMSYWATALSAEMAMAVQPERPGVSSKASTVGAACALLAPVQIISGSKCG